jgi:hypothetical protein
MASLATLRQRLQDNDNRYAARFAGQSRVTRDLALLDEIIATQQKLLAEVRASSGGIREREELVTDASRQLELLRNERTHILQAREQARSAGVEATELGTRANFVFHRYNRHFAAKSRATRDVTLIQDMLAELAVIAESLRTIANQRPDLQGPAADLEVIAGRVKGFEDERKAISAAQFDSPPQEQASALAGIANELFGQYRTVFAGQPRVSRRPEMLLRLVGALQDVHERMCALQTQGLADSHNDGNVGIVADRLAAWQSELTAVRAERQKASVASLVADLGTAANAEFERYGEHFAGQARKTRNLDKLREILDRLDEVERQMTRLHDVHGRADNAANLRIVRDTMVMYIGEWEAILQAQQDG